MDNIGSVFYSRDNYWENKTMTKDLRKTDRIKSITDPIERSIELEKNMLELLYGLTNGILHEYEKTQDNTYQYWMKEVKKVISRVGSMRKDRQDDIK